MVLRLSDRSTGEVTTEPLTVIARDNPVVCALYAKDHGLLDKPGWKRFKKIANPHKKLICLVNQAKLRSYCSTPKYMFGYRIPRDYLGGTILPSFDPWVRDKDAAPRQTMIVTATWIGRMPALTTPRSSMGTKTRTAVPTQLMTATATASSMMSTTARTSPRTLTTGRHACRHCQSLWHGCGPQPAAGLLRSAVQQV